MKNECVSFGPNGGEFVRVNDGAQSVEPRYACLTAPTVVKAVVAVDGNMVDTVWAGAGGSHSWWKEAGGGLLKFPLKAGQTLRIEFSGECSFRIDWY